MDQKDWAMCQEPERLLEFVQRRVSERKVRLLHSACCRRVWDVLPGERSRQAVEVVERYADGLEDLSTLQTAAYAANRAWAEDEMGFGAPAATAALWRLEPSYFGLASDLEPLEMVVCVVQQLAFEWSWVFSDGVRRRDSEAAEQDEQAIQVAIIRDVFGDPFVAQPRIDPIWRAWNNGTVTRLAEQVYEDRQLPSGKLDPGLLAVVADALVDAGCNETWLLDHLLGPAEHYRGCWAVDLLTGRE